jgi:hypothetical protein
MTVSGGKLVCRVSKSTPYFRNFVGVACVPVHLFLIAICFEQQ